MCFFMQTIPEEFTTNFRGHISDVVKLQAPDGNIYNIQVAREQDKLVLRSGWLNFAVAYELEQFDFLFFIYSGDSHFKVRILKPSGSEKELSCVIMNYGPNVQDSGGQSLPTERRHRSDRSSGSRKTPKMTPADSPSQKSSSEFNS